MPADRLDAECGSSSSHQFRRDTGSRGAREWSYRDLECCCRLCWLALSIGKNLRFPPLLPPRCCVFLFTLVCIWCSWTLLLLLLLLLVDFEGLLDRMFEAMEECWCSPLFFESFGNVVPCVLHWSSWFCSFQLKYCRRS